MKDRFQYRYSTAFIIIKIVWEPESITPRFGIDIVKP